MLDIDPSDGVVGAPPKADYWQYRCGKADAQLARAKKLICLWKIVSFVLLAQSVGFIALWMKCNIDYY